RGHRIAHGPAEPRATQGSREIGLVDGGEAIRQYRDDHLSVFVGLGALDVDSHLPLRQRGVGANEDGEPDEPGGKESSQRNHGREPNTIPQPKGVSPNGWHPPFGPPTSRRTVLRQSSATA